MRSLMAALWLLAPGLTLANGAPAQGEAPPPRIPPPGEAAVEIISPRADAVSVTVYRDLFALITETRTVDLPAGEVTLSFDGVVETLIPASAELGAMDRAQVERNFDYDTLAPANLLHRSVGKDVVLTRTLPGSGKVIQTAATILAANDGGVTLRTADGHEALRCSGLPEGLTFTQIPGDLQPTPRLSVRLGAGPPGKRVVKLSYIAQGFAWKSDYVAHLSSDGRRLDLTGWVTLRNLTRASLRNAEVQVVAGRLNLIYVEDGGSSTIGNSSDFGSEQELQESRDQRLAEMASEPAGSAIDLAFLHGCYPLSGLRPPSGRPLPQRSQRFGSSMISPGYYDAEFEEVIVTGMRASLNAPEMLADYHLYRIPWATDLAARQTKQVVFLQKNAVKAESFYGVRIDPDDMEYDDDPLRPQVLLSFENRKSSGLGEPLPGGMFRLFEATDSGWVFAGESTVGDKPVGVPVELTLANALDLAAEVTAVEDEDADEDESDVVVRVTNAKASPVLVEIRQLRGDSDDIFSVLKATHRTGSKFGDPVWRLKVPANSVRELRYRLRVEDPPEPAGE